MASYTMQLREYVEQASQNEELSSRERISKGKEKLFDFDYPIFDDNYKNIFETNFIRNFYVREIGFETEGLFKFQLETWLLINMPYFNKMFESEMLSFDPLHNSEMSITHNRTSDKIQNDNRDKSQNDKKNKLQADKNDRTHNDNRTKIQNDNNFKTQNDDRDIQQNDRILKDQDDRRNTEQNDNTTIHQDGTQKTLSTQKSDQLQYINGESEDVTDIATSGDSEKTIKATDKVDNFNRDLESNNPDTRLAITTNDGQGIITYASTIKENNENNLKTSDSKATGKESAKNKTTSDSTTHQETTNEVEQEGTDDTETVSDQNTILISSTEDVLNSSIDESLDRAIGDRLLSTVDERFDGSISDKLISSTIDKFDSKVDDTLESKINDKLTSSINDIEDYVEHRVGKIGTQSYSELLKEYRNSFLRIEKQIFSEMNELFMLVY